MKNNDYRVIYTLQSGTVLERTVSMTQVKNLLVHHRYNRNHCEIAVRTEEGELIGECLSGTDETLPDEYRYGWYNTDLVEKRTLRDSLRLAACGLPDQDSDPVPGNAEKTLAKAVSNGN